MLNFILLLISFFIVSSIYLFFFVKYYRNRSDKKRYIYDDKWNNLFGALMFLPVIAFELYTWIYSATLELMCYHIDLKIFLYIFEAFAAFIPFYLFYNLVLVKYKKKYKRWYKNQELIRSGKLKDPVLEVINRDIENNTKYFSGLKVDKASKESIISTVVGAYTSYFYDLDSKIDLASELNAIDFLGISEDAYKLQSDLDIVKKLAKKYIKDDQEMEINSNIDKILMELVDDDTYNGFKRDLVVNNLASNLIILLTLRDRVILKEVDYKKTYKDFYKANGKNLYDENIDYSKFSTNKKLKESLEKVKQEKKYINDSKESLILLLNALEKDSNINADKKNEIDMEELKIKKAKAKEDKKRKKLEG